MNIRMNRFNGIYFSNFKWGIMAILCFSLGGCSSTGGMADAEYAVVTQKLEQNEADITFYRSLYHCAQFMHEGKYKSAQPYCAIAGDIRPDDDAYRRTYQMLRDEMES